MTAKRPPLLFQKGHGGILIPADAAAQEFVTPIKLGADVWGEFRRARNAKFHRKFFALLDLAFETWEPVAGASEYRGKPIEKNKERFRAEILILSGHYDAVYSIKGDVRLIPKSISFTSIDDVEFERVYRGVLNVVWAQIMKNSRYSSPNEVDNIVNRLIGFE